MAADLEAFLAAADRPAASAEPAGRRHRSRAATAALDVVEEIARLSAVRRDFDGLLQRVGLLVCRRAGAMSAAWLDAQDGLRQLVGQLEPDGRLVAVARRRRAPARQARPDRSATQLAVAIGRGGSAGGVLVVERAAPWVMSSEAETRLLTAVGAQLDAAFAAEQAVRAVDETVRRTELLLRIDTDLSADLDVPRVLNQLVDHALALFGAQHAAILRPTDAGGFQIEVARRISAAARRVFESEPTLPLTAQALAEQRVISETDYARDRRAGHFREWLLEEGINTVTVVPLVSGGVSMAGLALYHDIAYEWDPAELALLQRMGRRAADALRNAELFRQTSRWAAQLHSIQQLGVRLNRLNTVGEIGRAIASELDQLISCDNVRVYRLVGDDCLPVAWRGRVGEYEEEDGDQLRCKVGEGVTGWVALHGLAQNVADAANDERSVTIPGTDDGLPESLLLAPMLFEDAVIGIIVLAKLGLRQFSADDLRLLEIYASIAAQAMVNADSTEQLRAQSEQLEQQLTNQRELLRVTESILGTLETDALLDEISHRIGSVLHADNVVIDRYDEGAGLIRPLVAHGINAADFMARTLTDREGVGAVVVRTGQALLVRDMLADPRIIHFDRQEPHPGALIVVPLRARDRVTGLLSIERLGETASFSQDELELVQLFAAHVSIALNNARVHRAVELRAETDALTGLWNQGALDQHLQRTVEDGAPFGLLMVDLDNFKDYNDRFGHQAGNLILRRLGQAIRSACRHSDLVFRYGGDEFAVLLPNTPARRVPTVAGKVSEAVRSLEHDGGGEPAGLSCSIGWAALPADAADAAGIVLAADRACYAAKRQGRDRIADAAEGLASAPEFKSPAPTPVDEAGAYSLA